MSITDEYTGLYNVRYMHEILGGLLAKTKKSASQLAAVFMDIDNFKHIVDSNGHLAGSKVLREIGLTIKSCLDQQDILIKYGGDEYVLLLPDTSKAEAKIKMESIKEKINKSIFLQEEGKNIRVTASAGIAVFPEDAKSKKTLLLKADNLMYTIKNAHKDGIATIG